MAIKTFKIKPVKAVAKKQAKPATKKNDKKQFTLEEEFRNEYGLTMDLNDLAKTFHVQKRTIQNMLYDERLPLKTFSLKRKGSTKGGTLVTTRDVVRYIVKGN